MQAITIACSVLFVIVDFAHSQDDISNSLYTKRYERLDIDTILASPRLVTNYVECLLNKKPCAPEGKALKRILPEALRTKCGRCHPSQKEVALKVINALYFDYPQYYKALQEKWDPTGEYNRRFEEYLRDQKFNSIGGGDAEQGEQAQGSSLSINITQRPTRQGQGAQSQGAAPSPGQGQGQPQGQSGQIPDAKPSAPPTDDKALPEILNRFGGDDSDGYEYEKPTPVSSTSSPPVVDQQPQKPQPSPKPQPTQQPQKPQTQRPQPAPSPTAAPSKRPSNHNGNHSPNSGGSSKPAHTPSGSHPASLPSHNNWNQHNHPAPGLSTTTTYYLQTQNPVLNIINRITMKFANTAEFIAGMLRAAVPQPQAPIQNDDILRKFCNRLRKTFMSYTNNNQNTKYHHQRYY